MYALYFFSAIIKTTFGRVKHEFGHFYPLFQTHWNFVLRYFNGELPVEHFAISTWRIKEKLKKRVVKF